MSDAPAAPAAEPQATPAPAPEPPPPSPEAEAHELSQPPSTADVDALTSALAVADRGEVPEEPPAPAPEPPEPEATAEPQAAIEEPPNPFGSPEPEPGPEDAEAARFAKHFAYFSQKENELRQKEQAVKLGESLQDGVEAAKQGNPFPLLEKLGYDVNRMGKAVLDQMDGKPPEAPKADATEDSPVMQELRALREQVQTLAQEKEQAAKAAQQGQLLEQFSGFVVHNSERFPNLNKVYGPEVAAQTIYGLLEQVHAERGVAPSVNEAAMALEAQLEKQRQLFAAVGPIPQPPSPPTTPKAPATPPSTPTVLTPQHTQASTEPEEDLEQIEDFAEYDRKLEQKMFDILRNG